MNIASGFPKFVRQSVLQDENFNMASLVGKGLINRFCASDNRY